MSTSFGTTPTFYSQQGEDLLIYRNFINKNVENGVFLELGACDGVVYSNTLFFEQFLGFHGILIEPVKEMYDRLSMNRPNNFLYNSAISSSVEDIEFLVNGPVSGALPNMQDTFIDGWHKHSIRRKMKTKKLSDIFDENDIQYIDLFSLDVEGSELDVLNTIDWSKVSIYLICIELDDHNVEKDEQCRKLLRENGFIFKTKSCINEFWMNPNYERIDKLFDDNKKGSFSGNMNDYGIHRCLEPHCKSIIEKAISEYENDE